MTTRVYQLLILMFVSAVLVLSGQARAQPARRPSPKIFAVLNTSSLIPGQQHVVAVVVDIPNGLHAQSATPVDENYIAFKVTLENVAEGLRVLPPVYPAGEDQTYPLLGKLNIYEGRVVVYLPVELAPTVAAGTTLRISGKVQNQLCNDQTCFIPGNDQFELTVTVAERGSAVTASEPALFKSFEWAVFSKSHATLPTSQMGGTGGGTAKSDDTVFGLSLAQGGYPLAFFAALLVGLIFNLMPCVLPVLPLKAVGFVEAAARSRARSVLLGLCFSAGMLSIFAVLGLAIYAGGQQWGFLFQQNWFVFPMSVVLVLFALSQWGLFTFRVPVGLYSYEPKHDTLSGNFMFGGLTALLSTPCTAPVFPTLLAWAATQPKLIGVCLLIAVGVGMAVPYFILSCFPHLARKVPRTGPWSEIVKQMMGFLILATAAYFAGTKLLQGFEFMYPVATISIIAAAFLIYRTARLMPRARPIIVASVVALLLTATSVYTTAALNRKTVEWVPYSDKTLANARAAGKTVLIDFTANWCVNCHYVESTVFSNQDVKQMLLEKDVLLMKVDITDPGAPGSDLLRQMNPAGGIPLTLIYFPDRAEPTQLASIYTAKRLLQTFGR